MANHVQALNRQPNRCIQSICRMPVGDPVAYSGESPEETSGFTYKVDVDHILKSYAGNIGFVQFAMIIIGSFTVPPAVIFPIFGNAELPHRCRLNSSEEEALSNLFQNQSSAFDDIAQLVGPWHTANKSGFAKGYTFGCERFLNPPLSPPLKSGSSDDKETVPCDQGYVYKYTSDQYPGNIVVEWNLVCDEFWKVPFSTSMYMMGMLFGFTAGGIAGDRFGRRLTALGACILEGLASVVVSLSPSYYVFIFFRFLLAAASTIKIAVILVLFMEMTTARQRSLVNSVWSFIQGFALRAVLSPIALCFQDWRWFHGILCSLTYFSFPLMFFFPESPRWLVSQGRTSEALRQLYRVYWGNQRMKLCKRSSAPLLTEAQFIELIQQEAQPLDNPRHPTSATAKTRKRSPCQKMFIPFSSRKLGCVTLQCIFLFAGQLATTFGLIFYGRSIRANIYLLNFLNSATQIPATVLSGLLYRFCKGRKVPIASMYLSAFVVLTFAAVYNFAVHPESDMVLTVCVNIALILLAASLNMVFMYVPELFPSEARALGLGLGAGLGRIGGVLCPLFNALDSIAFHGSPIVIYAAILLLEMLNLWRLPDTSGRNLPDNLEQQMVPGEEGDSEDEPPIWASTVDGLVASTSCIGGRRIDEHSIDRE